MIGLGIGLLGGIGSLLAGGAISSALGIASLGLGISGFLQSKKAQRRQKSQIRDQQRRLAKLRIQQEAAAGRLKKNQELAKRDASARAGGLISGSQFRAMFGETPLKQTLGTPA